MTSATASTFAVDRRSTTGLLAQARAVLGQAMSADDPQDRFRLAHLAALRTAAAVIADRGRPASVRRKLMSVWVLLDRVAPEYAEWSACFVAGASVRAAIDAGARSVVTARSADDQVRASWEFLALVEGSLGLMAA